MGAEGKQTNGRRGVRATNRGVRCRIEAWGGTHRTGGQRGRCQRGEDGSRGSLNRGGRKRGGRRDGAGTVRLGGLRVRVNRRCLVRFGGGTGRAAAALFRRSRSVSRCHRAGGSSDSRGRRTRARKPRRTHEESEQAGDQESYRSCCLCCLCCPCALHNNGYYTPLGYPVKRVGVRIAGRSSARIAYCPRHKFSIGSST